MTTTANVPDNNPVYGLAAPPSDDRFHSLLKLVG